MKIGAVVCEYNPFHNGHKYHLQKIQSSQVTHVVSVMSGDFTQRGEPAILSKYVRTKMALMNGADLVIELPTTYSMSYAENFAQSAIHLINALGCVDTISFGCETPDIKKFSAIIDFLETNEYRQILKKALTKGLTFAKARSETIKCKLGKNYAQILNYPNNILALEYIKAMYTNNMDLEILPIKRIDAHHDSITHSDNIASAKHIRDLLKSQNNEYKQYIPENTYELIQDELLHLRAPTNISYIERGILAKMHTISKNALTKLPDVTEGLENKFKKDISNSSSLTELILNVKSKRYTYARLQRIPMYAFLGIKKKHLNTKPPYIKILGLNKKGQEILSVAKQTASLPIISKNSQIKSCDKLTQKIFKRQETYSRIYELCMPQTQPLDRNIIYVDDD